MGKISEALEKTNRWRPNTGETKQEDNGSVAEAPSILPASANFPEPGDVLAVDQVPAVSPEQRRGKARPTAKPSFDKGKIDPRMVALFSPQSYEAEQFRMLRTNILFPPNGTPARSIMVTSVAPNEGKSFTAANIALSIAQNIDKHVLLIDCDMRHPCLHTMLGFGHVKGLSDHLNDNIPLAELLLKGPGERLSLLAGGTVPPNPSELLSSNRMAALLREVKSRYSDRFIIIDSPPPQLTSEAVALSHLVDGVLLIFRSNYSNKEGAKDLIEKIGRERFIGVVANQVQRNEITYYGDKKYGDYGKYFSNK